MNMINIIKKLRHQTTRITCPELSGSHAGVRSGR
jgi:hypothetical protein